MPYPKGRPLGESRGVGRYLDEAEDVLRFQEVESEEEKNGVLLEPGYHQDSQGREFNPDELYFNDMDLRAWEARTAEIDGMAYGDEYGYQEDEGYYEEPGRILMTAAEYEEFLFLRVLDKIRLARATGDRDVQLTTEELDAYSKGMRPRAPAVRPQPPRGRPVSAPMITGAVTSGMNNTLITTNAPSINGSGSGSGSTRRKTSKPRTSIFAPRPKKDKEKSNSRKRTTSNVSETLGQLQQQPAQAPGGFVVPGPNGPVYAPINAYAGRMRRDSTVRSAGSPSRESRSSSLNSRHAANSQRITPPREIPGAFPSGSPQRYYRDGTPPPRQSRPPSSHSRYSMGEAELTPNTRSRSSSIQQPVKLVPYPVTDYQHYTAEPYQYHQPGQPAQIQPPAQASASQPQYRRVVSGPADPNYTAMPRRVPVPVQRATGPISASYSDPALTQAHTSRDDASDENDDITVDVIPQADDKSYKVTAKPAQKQVSTGASAKDSDRRRSSGRTRRKN